MVRACEKVNRSSPRPRARTPRPRSNSTWSLFRKAIGRAKRIASIKPRAAVLKSENREWASPAENRALAHVDWLREGPEGPTLRLTQDSLAEGIDRHLRKRSEEHTSELQSQSNLVCRLLLEKKKKNTWTYRCSWRRSTEASRASRPGSYG